MSNADAIQIGDAGVKQLRHDLLNYVNVLFGTTTVLLETDLSELQRTCVIACRNSAQYVLEIANHLQRYQQQETIDGQAQLADLCSIAAARIDKPFDREALLAVVRNLAPGPSPRILLVDDAPDIAVLVRAYLKDTSATVDVVADGQRAVAQASSQPYDLVLMDVNLPGLDGATAAHAIRAADLARGAKPAPVVALSAVGGQLGEVSAQTSEDVVIVDDPDTAPLVPGFLDNRRDDARTMRALLEGADFARIESIGHQMKGTGRSYGLSVISRLGEAIERAAHQHDASSIQSVLTDLDAYLSRVKVDIRAQPS
ncbi:MAG TPA: response regulator [Vicinamibacterales bacterium]|nr:response regulator [Vicinamibacterales bacterium]